MPLITIGSLTDLQLKIPSKGDTDWGDDLKTEAWTPISIHDHTGASGKGVKIPTGGITDLAVTTGKVAADAITEAKLADDAVQVEHKLTTVLTLNGSAQSLTGLAMSADQAWKLTYKVNNAAGSSVQIGTAMGQAGDFITDEFVGTDLSADYSYSTNQLQITGTNTDVLEYSIDFLE